MSPLPPRSAPALVLCLILTLVSIVSAMHMGPTAMAAPEHARMQMAAPMQMAHAAAGQDDCDPGQPRHATHHCPFCHKLPGSLDLRRPDTALRLLSAGPARPGAPQALRRAAFDHAISPRAPPQGPA